MLTEWYSQEYKVICQNTEMEKNSFWKMYIAVIINLA